MECFKWQDIVVEKCAESYSYINTLNTDVSIDMVKVAVQVVERGYRVTVTIDYGAAQNPFVVSKVVKGKNTKTSHGREVHPANDADDCASAYGMQDRLSDGEPAVPDPEIIGSLSCEDITTETGVVTPCGGETADKPQIPAQLGCRSLQKTTESMGTIDVTSDGVLDTVKASLEPTVPRGNWLSVVYNVDPDIGPTCVVRQWSQTDHMFILSDMSTTVQNSSLWSGKHKSNTAVDVSSSLDPQYYCVADDVTIAVHTSQWPPLTPDEVGAYMAQVTNLYTQMSCSGGWTSDWQVWYTTSPVKNNIGSCNSHWSALHVYSNHPKCAFWTFKLESTCRCEGSTAGLVRELGESPQVTADGKSEDEPPCTVLPHDPSET